MASISWKNPVSGDWNVASNWSTGAVPTLGDDVTIMPAVAVINTPFIVTVSSADQANSLTFFVPQGALLENAGSLTIAGALTVDFESGFVSLNEANTIGSVTLAGGVLAFGNGGALGTGTISMSGGELLGTANETIANPLAFSAARGVTPTIAATHGTTLNENAPNYSVSADTTLNFGSVGEDGTVLWHTGTGSGISFPFPGVHVQAGTLKGADTSFSFILMNAAQTTVDAGATIDIGGFDTTIADLTGAGAVTDGGAAATLTLGAANFSGTISGPLSLVAGGAVVLNGANTYTGTTTINSGDSLQIGAGATGSTGAGAISDAGTLTIDASNAITFASAISGAGVLSQIGTGVTAINSANTYSGGTTISAGTLAIGNGAALGTGAVTVSGGELLGTANETVTNHLVFSGSSTIAAAHGTTLNENASNYFISANTTLNFGSPGQDGTVLWHTGGGSNSIPFPGVHIQAGTLKAADADFSRILSNAAQTTVDAGASIDLAGFSARISGLTGAGAVTDSGAAATLSLAAAFSGTISGPLPVANFSGTISGPLSLVFDENATLSGLEDFSGGAALNTAAVANAGTYDIVANGGIAGTLVTSFINNGLFEKTGGGGVSDVT